LLFLALSHLDGLTARQVGHDHKLCSVQVAFVMLSQVFHGRGILFSTRNPVAVAIVATSFLFLFPPVRVQSLFAILFQHGLQTPH
jgi:hypothetical protein